MSATTEQFVNCGCCAIDACCPGMPNVLTMHIFVTDCSCVDDVFVDVNFNGQFWEGTAPLGNCCREVTINLFCRPETHTWITRASITTNVYPNDQCVLSGFRTISLLPLGSYDCQTQDFLTVSMTLPAECCEDLVNTTCCECVPTTIPITVHAVNCDCADQPLQYSLTWNGSVWEGGGSLGNCNSEITLRVSCDSAEWVVEASFADDCGGWTGFQVIQIIDVYECNDLSFLDVTLPEIPGCCEHTVPCCPSALPGKLFANISNIDCSCAGTFSFPIFFNGSVWTGSAALGTCGFTITVTAYCDLLGTSGLYIWYFEISVAGCLTTQFLADGGGCPPISTFVCVPSICGCGPAGQLTITVTE